MNILIFFRKMIMKIAVLKQNVGYEDDVVAEKFDDIGVENMNVGNVEDWSS